MADLLQLAIAPPALPHSFTGAPDQPGRVGAAHPFFYVGRWPRVLTRRAGEEMGCPARIVAGLHPYNNVRVPGRGSRPGQGTYLETLLAPAPDPRRTWGEGTLKNCPTEAFCGAVLHKGWGFKPTGSARGCAHTYAGTHHHFLHLLQSKILARHCMQFMEQDSLPTNQHRKEINLKFNTCRFCQKSPAVDGGEEVLLKYAVRHWAHPSCGLRAHGVNFLSRLTLSQIRAIPIETLIHFRGAAVEVARRVQVENKNG